MLRRSTSFSLLLCALSLVSAQPILAQPQAPVARIVEDLRLDANKEDFPNISNFFVGPRHQIVVPIGVEMKLIVYDSTGKRTAVIGRKGSGPGEFRWVHALGWKVDTLYVIENSQRRISFFTPEGRLLRTTVYVPIREIQFPNGKKIGKINNTGYWLRAIRPDGSSLVDWNEPRGGSPMLRAFGTSYIVRMSADGRARWLVTPPTRGDERWTMIANDFSLEIPFLFWPVEAISANGDRYAYMTVTIESRTGGFISLAAFTSLGDTLFARIFPFVGIPIPQSVRDSAVTALLKTREAGPEDVRKFQEISRRKMPFVYPAAESVLLGLDNTIWLELRNTVKGRPSLVLNHRGDPIATVIVPSNSKIRQASATHIWVSEKDDDGLTSIVRYRVSGISCGAIGC